MDDNNVILLQDQSSKKLNSIKVLSFNVENLTPKLEEQEFQHLMNNHDICLFSETWLTNNKKLGVPQFWDFHVVRSK